MYEPPPPTPADVSPFAPEHPGPPGPPGMPTPAPEPAPEPEPAPIQEPAAAAMSWAPAETPAAPPETAGPSSTSPPPTSDWPAPGKPETPAAAPARESGGGAGSPTWTPVQTGSWTPGPAHASSSEWTGEATPIPGPVPAELREAISTPSYTAPATYSPPAVAPVTTPPIPRAPAPAPAKKPAPKRQKRDDDYGGMPSGRPRWVVPAAIGVVLLLIIGGGGAYALSRAGSSTTGAGNPSPSAKPSTKSSPTPTNLLKDVPVYAPATAAPVTSVVIDPANSSCTQIGGSCKLEVDIKFSSVQRGNVSFIIKYFDRCAGTTQDLPGAGFTPPGFNLVILDKTVTLPAGPKAAAVVVVTQSPSVAASAPITLGANSC